MARKLNPYHHKRYKVKTNTEEAITQILKDYKLSRDQAVMALEDLADKHLESFKRRTVHYNGITMNPRYM
jgi:hypothetical protein